MICISDINKNVRHDKKQPGSYEWWYFDGVSEDDDYQIVIIFYDGCPFSTRYVREIDSKSGTSMALPYRYPGITISVYYKGEPIFYSMSHYPSMGASFSNKEPVLSVGENTLRISDREKHGASEYSGCDIRINERLPSGDELKGIITFTGMRPPASILPDQKLTQEEDSHVWNLIMPRADMSCRVNLIQNGLIKKELKFEGTGYHDHNIGYEPMREAFRDWYWGRVHFRNSTLIYYVMNDLEKNTDARAWVISRDNRRLLYTLELEKIGKKKTTTFLLRPSRRLTFQAKELQITVDHRRMIDNGPFYCRYLSRAIIEHPALDMEEADGFGEYIRPDRIHKKRFWPLLHMRMRYVDQNPHWVQRSKKLYRWTW